MDGLGIDIGGSGIKGAPVDLSRGELTAERHRVPTPDRARPHAVAKVVGEVVAHFDWDGPIGCTFPAVVKDGFTCTAANVDKSWIGTDARSLLVKATDLPVTVVNDADAAGIAEMGYGAGRDRAGVVVMITLGTGLGSAVFLDGKLVPNSELGHIEIDGHDAESKASDRARQEEDLSWGKWAKRLSIYLQRLDGLLWPDLIILGGGVSKKSSKFLPLLDVRCEVVPAHLLNNAGIVGAALAARDGAPLRP
ncbi:MAG: ROK family protein [Actinomycetota bacterium]|nr:ROK family protein [Actinomycetota bacterium]